MLATQLPTPEFLAHETDKRRGEMLAYVLPDGRRVQIARDAVQGEMEIDFQCDGKMVKAFRIA